MKHPMTEEELVRRLHSLSREITPENDVWDGIVGRINSGTEIRPQRRAGLPFMRLAIAAGFVLLLGTGLVINLLRTADGLSPVTESIPQLSRAKAYGEIYQMGPGVLSELEYQAAFREFLALDSVPVQLETQTSIPLDFGWETTRQAEIALAEALRKDPGNLFLKKRLSALRARQLELLQTIAAVEMASRRNTI